MNIEKMKAFAQAQRESEESTEIRPAPKPAEPQYQPEAIYIPIEDDDPTEIPDDGFAAVSNEEEPELPEEINMELYLKMFMRYLHKNHKRLYLLVESEEEGQEAFRYLQKAYSGIQLVGLAKVSAEGRADDMLVNAINTEAMVNVRLSFGTIIPELKEVSQSYKEAGMALDVGRIFYPERNILSYRELGIGRLIHQLPVSLCEMFLEEVFAGNTVDQFDEETLSTVDKFFENIKIIKENNPDIGDSETAFRPPEYARLPAGEDPEADRAGCQSL